MTKSPGDKINGKLEAITRVKGIPEKCIANKVHYLSKAESKRNQEKSISEVCVDFASVYNFKHCHENLSLSNFRATKTTKRDVNCGLA
jgi:hypothetical protein